MFDRNRRHCRFQSILIALTAWSVLSSAADAQDEEQRIWRALDAKTSWTVKDVTLEQLVGHIRQKHSINVFLDRRSLEDVGVDQDVKINSQVTGISLGSALSLALDELEVTWTVYQEVLWITTRDREEEMLTTRVYDVKDLVHVPVGGYDAFRISADYDMLIETLQDTIQPNSWDEVGGYGSISGFAAKGRHALTIRQTPRVQRKVERLLSQLRTIGGTAATSSRISNLPMTKAQAASRHSKVSQRTSWAAPSWSRPVVHD